LLYSVLSGISMLKRRSPVPDFRVPEFRVPETHRREHQAIVPGWSVCPPVRSPM